MGSASRVNTIRRRSTRVCAHRQGGREGGGARAAAGHVRWAPASVRATLRVPAATGACPPARHSPPPTGLHLASPPEAVERRGPPGLSLCLRARAPPPPPRLTGAAPTLPALRASVMSTACHSALFNATAALPSLPSLDPYLFSKVSTAGGGRGGGWVGWGEAGPSCSSSQTCPLRGAGGWVGGWVGG